MPVHSDISREQAVKAVTALAFYGVVATGWMGITMPFWVRGTVGSVALLSVLWHLIGQWRFWKVRVLAILMTVAAVGFLWNALWPHWLGWLGMDLSYLLCPSGMILAALSWPTRQIDPVEDRALLSMHRLSWTTWILFGVLVGIVGTGMGLAQFQQFYDVQGGMGVHILAGVGAVVLVFAVFLDARRMKRTRSDLSAMAHVTWGLILVQAGSGSLLRWGGLSKDGQWIHVLGAPLLLATVGYMALQTLPRDPAGVRRRP